MYWNSKIRTEEVADSKPPDNSSETSNLEAANPKTWDSLLKQHFVSPDKEPHPIFTRRNKQDDVWTQDQNMDWRKTFLPSMHPK
ncbi:hypothetical protein JTE90_018624 [Oedothorax gibbosus]|uniref:Uncharacterized protein n=1 Tax=Oedothorax gibbosus TaxID=931172 RepID=A0AAV6UNQ6_9ARAC|nr:hypothetical protein JTE90_018624 [Oedothorax gibbosus]